jgi:hypothetical protein
MISLILSTLNYLLTSPSRDFAVSPGVGDLSHQARVLELVAVYIEVVEWFVNVGLLPEFPCEDLALVDDGCEAGGEFGPHRVPYPASALAKVYQKRYMFGLNALFINVTCIILTQV